MFRINAPAGSDRGFTPFLGPNSNRLFDRHHKDLAKAMELINGCRLRESHEGSGSRRSRPVKGTQNLPQYPLDRSSEEEEGKET